VSSALQTLAELVKRESGIELKPSQLPSLGAALARIDPDLSAAALLAQPSAGRIEQLIDEITIRETFFFRHRPELDAIDWHALLGAARGRGSEAIRVWVAGCASGEEAYTVAILACEAFACPAPPIRVLATDIAPTALAQARAGRYGPRATRALPAEVHTRYFDTQGRVLSVGERLRGLVEFRRHNLVADPAPVGGSPFDVILCRNVLIYFDRPTIERVLRGLEGALSPTGLLLLGAADRLSGRSPGVSRSRPRTRGRSRATARPALSPAAAPKTIVPASPTAAAALQAADRGELDLAIRIAEGVLAEDPLDREAHFIHGLVELARGNVREAVEPLRRALYIDPNFSIAAFKLASAHDALGESEPARRAYERTLRTLDQCAERPAARDRQFDLVEITVACHSRLRALAGFIPGEIVNRTG